MNETADFRQVSKDEFYKKVGPLDVHPSIVNGRWPYTSMWQLRSRQIVGKSVGNSDGSHTYFLAA